MRNQKPSTSIVVCCYTEERWDALIAAIESCQKQTLAAHEIVIVVDYNLQLQERLQQRFPTLTVTENKERKGLSGARNTGIRSSTGDLIAFLDDDAIAEPDWLANLVRQLEDPAVMGAGGQIVPNWLDGFPKWFPKEFYWVVGCTYRGMPEQAAPVRNLIGGCMCIRREVFELVGGFRSEIGRVGTIPLGCEETEFCIRARQARPDQQFVYEPTARIDHEVPGKRTTWHYFRSRCYAEGISKALVARLVGAKDGLSAETAYTLRTLPTGVLMGLAAVFRGDWRGPIRAVAIVAGLAFTTLGYLAGRMSGQSLQFAAPVVGTNAVSQTIKN